MRPKISDIAKQAGISPGSVSRALSPEGKYYVSPKTRKRVEDAAKALGYHPNYLGRALAGGNSGLVCLLAPGPFSSYYTTVARRLAHQSAKVGYSLITDCAFDAQAHNQDATEIPRQEWLYGVDGIVACDPADWHREYLAEALRLKIPVVTISTQATPSVDSVVIDLYTPTLRLVHHLIEQGRRSIAMLVPFPPGGPRADAYQTALSEAGLQENYLCADEFNRKSGRDAVLGSKLDFDALFCANDELAVGASRALSELGRAVPEDVAVAGCDGIEEAEFHNPPITTIVQPLDEICASAWDILKRRMDGYDGDIERIEVEPSVDFRKSTVR
jgi:LacI family transcriptional regulator